MNGSAFSARSRARCAKTPIKFFHDATPATSLKIGFQRETHSASSGLVHADNFRRLTCARGAQGTKLVAAGKNHDSALPQPEAVPKVR